MRNHPGSIDDLNDRALAAALDIARSVGIDCRYPVVMKDSYNAVIHLRPSPIVARVATLTSVVRENVGQHVAREIAVANFLAASSAAGGTRRHHGRSGPATAAAVAPPTSTIPPGPYESDGMWLSLWDYIAHTPHRRPADVEVAPRLAELHELLRGYDGPGVPLEAAFDDLDRLVSFLSATGVTLGVDVGLLESELVRARTGLAAGGYDYSQALHGDAHAGNMLVTPNGVVWVDFEETCIGPVEWDLACLSYRNSEPNQLIERYWRECDTEVAGRPGVDSEGLRSLIRARWVEAVAWTSCLAIHRPDRRNQAEAFVREWLDWLRRGG